MSLSISRITAAAVFLLISISFPVSGVSQEYPLIKPFELTLSYEYDDSGKILMDIAVSIGYNRLVFFKHNNEFQAAYRVVMEAYHDSEGFVRGDVWEEKVGASGYSQTRSSANISHFNRKVYLGPGKYRIDVKIEVLGTSIEYIRKGKIEIPGKNDGVAFISEPVFSIPQSLRLGEKPPQGEIKISLCRSQVSSGFRLNQDGIFYGFDTWLRAAFSLSVPASGAGDEKRLVSVKIVDREGETISYNRLFISGDRVESNMFCADINVDSFKMGNYGLLISSGKVGGEEGQSVRKDFAVIFNRASLDENLDDTIELLSIIAPGEDLDTLKNAALGDRFQIWKTFWDKRRDSGRGLEDFLGNISYVMKNFPESNEGWKSDRGRIFILNGKPDRVIERQGGVYGTYYEFWYYYSEGVVYVFSDRFGTGDFRLISTSPI